VQLSAGRLPRGLLLLSHRLALGLELDRSSDVSSASVILGKLQNRVREVSVVNGGDRAECNRPPYTHDSALPVRDRSREVASQFM
jgi:hypothetical protein